MSLSTFLSISFSLVLSILARPPLGLYQRFPLPRHNSIKFQVFKVITVKISFIPSNGFLTLISSQRLAKPKSGSSSAWTRAALPNAPTTNRVQAEQASDSVGPHLASSRKGESIQKMGVNKEWKDEGEDLPKVRCLLNPLAILWLLLPVTLWPDTVLSPRRL